MRFVVDYSVYKCRKPGTYNRFTKFRTSFQSGSGIIIRINQWKYRGEDGVASSGAGRTGKC